uniref:Uncharacterized protein n=1 Tax=Coccidioides posadasii RMSCC 3488 TaxID=454284 RepID=A0A0J6FSE3_COCPO|nr:hypothetical protein CPAG_09576 [Coccidioides posadasii RMSCC 3488]
MGEKKNELPETYGDEAYLYLDTRHISLTETKSFSESKSKNFRHYAPPTLRFPPPHATPTSSPQHEECLAAWGEEAKGHTSHMSPGRWLNTACATVPRSHNISALGTRPCHRARPTASGAGVRKLCGKAYYSSVRSTEHVSKIVTYVLTLRLGFMPHSLKREGFTRLPLSLGYGCGPLRFATFSNTSFTRDLFENSRPRRLGSPHLSPKIIATLPWIRDHYEVGSMNCEKASLVQGIAMTLQWPSTEVSWVGSTIFPRAPPIFWRHLFFFVGELRSQTRKTGSSTRVKTAKKLSQHFFHTITLLSKRLMTNPDVTGEFIPSRAFLGKEEKAAPQLVVLAQRASISPGEPHGSGKLDIPWIARDIRSNMIYEKPSKSGKPGGGKNKTLFRDDWEDSGRV